jgi:amidohydrolase
MTTLQQLADEAEKHFDYMVETRRYLHRNPEVSFKEFDTTAFIIGELEKLNLEIHRPLETGCVAIINGAPSDRVIALRADIDALAMDEEGEHKKGFLSERAGAAHCCGHDAHTTNLLTVAKMLSERRDEIQGKVLLIFQPGEEKSPGGGRLLTESGFLQKQGVQAVYGLHTTPDFSPGTIAIKPGPLMARTDEVEVEIRGKGGHAAAPHTAIDPIVMASEAVMAIQTIISRGLNPTEPAVITFGKFHGGNTHNVIPEKVDLMGTIRSFSDETADFLMKRIHEVLDGITKAHGGSYTCRFNPGYPAVINSEKETETVIRVAGEVIGKENIIEMKRPWMAGEDFAFYLKEFPGAFFFLGSGSDESDSKWSWHHPKYNVDERSMITGAALLCAIALDGRGK